MLYRNSRMDTYRKASKDCDATTLDHPVIVRLDAESIYIEINDGGEIYSYTGQAEGDGHYRMKGDRYGGVPFQSTGSLHRFANEREMDGYWREEGTEGMWRIYLEE